MPFSEFLALVKVVKMLYGREFAAKFFTNNVGEYYNLSSASLFKQEKD